MQLYEVKSKGNPRILIWREFPLLQNFQTIPKVKYKISAWKLKENIFFRTFPLASTARRNRSQILSRLRQGRGGNEQQIETRIWQHDVPDKDGELRLNKRKNYARGFL